MTAKKSEAVDTSTFDLDFAHNRISNLKPMQYVVQNLLVQGNLYALTAKANHGKTTLATRLAGAITKGELFGSLKTKQGKVLWLSGENAYDTDLKFKAAHERNFADLTECEILPMAIDLQKDINKLLRSAAHHIYSLVVVDSLQAYAGGVDLIMNDKALDNIKACRKLTGLNGNPAVVVLAHPIKNADKDNLIPYGGGSAYNELDGNLTLWKTDDIATLSHMKLRQPSFPQTKYELDIHTFKDLPDGFGGQTTTTVFNPLTYSDAEMKEQIHRDNCEKILNFLKTSDMSNPQLARQIFGKDDDASVKRMQRMVQDWRDKNFIKATGTPSLTKQGKDYLLKT
jgi:hypothetical protein